MPVIIGSKAEKANMIIAALVAVGVDLEGCDTEDKIKATLTEAFQASADDSAVEKELEKAVAKNETLTAELETAKTEAATHKAKAEAFEKRLGKVDPDNASEPEKKEEAADESQKDKKYASESLDDKISVAVAKAVADHYKAAGGGLETIPGDQGKDEGSETAIEDLQTEDEFFEALAAATSAKEQDRIHAAMRKKFPL